MNRKVVSLFLTALMAASILGVAYAHWNDYIWIHGTAEMGSLTFGFTEIRSEWDSENYYDYPPEKDTGEGICVLSEEEFDPHTEKTVYKVLTFTITGAYPQYWAINKFTLDNAGTIPLSIHSVTLTLPEGFIALESADYPGAMWEICDERGLVVFNLWLYKEPENYGPGWGTDPPWMFPGDFGTTTGVRALVCNQIDPCNELLTEICVDFKQDAQECHTYEFNIEIEAIQWNKHMEMSERGD